jgi:DNA-binding MarR family transcriptional regulator
LRLSSELAYALSVKSTELAAVPPDCGEVTERGQRIIELVFTLVGQLSGQFIETAARHKLTTMQAKVLWLAETPTAMRLIAQGLHCDASNITGVVDRLEARGLVERRSDPDDRRIKQIVRTPAGREVAQRLRAEMYASVPALQRLDEQQQCQLIALLETLTGTAPEPEREREPALR